MPETQDNPNDSGDVSKRAVAASKQTRDLAREAARRLKGDQ